MVWWSEFQPALLDTSVVQPLQVRQSSPIVDSADQMSAIPLLKQPDTL